MPNVMDETPEDVLNGIRDALESRGYFHMANGRDIGLLLDQRQPAAPVLHHVRGPLGQSIPVLPTPAADEGVEVYSHPNCTFNYCPHRELCAPNGCVQAAPRLAF